MLRLNTKKNEMPGGKAFSQRDLSPQEGTIKAVDDTGEQVDFDFTGYAVNRKRRPLPSVRYGITTKMMLRKRLR